MVLLSTVEVVAVQSRVVKAMVSVMSDAELDQMTDVMGRVDSAIDRLIETAR